MMFSLIIPVYNVEKYLRECLESVLCQTYGDWEAICINDGSTDGSATILEEYAAKDSRFKVISQANGGLSAARNSGLEAASGDYVLFLDSDDYLGKDALRIIADNLSDEDLLCFSGRRFFEESGKYEKADVLPQESFETGWEYYSKHALDKRNFAFVCVVLRCYRRAYLLENRLRFKPGIYHEDNMFTPLACYYAKKVKIIPDVLYDYRVRGSSIMTTRSLKHKEDILTIANSLAAFFVPQAGIEKTTVYKALTHHYQSVFIDKVSRKEERHLLSMVDWKLYKTVSRTKARHRVQYLALRISPSLFRLIAKI